MMINKRIHQIVLSLSLLAIVLAAPVTALATPDVAGGPIVVTTFQDEFNTDGDCALREAVVAANTDAAVDQCPAGSGTDTIILSAGIYGLSKAGSGEDQSLTGDLDILADVHIQGSRDGETVIDGGDLDRVFHVSGVIEVSFSHLTVRNGNVPGIDETSRGGGILVEQAAVTMADCRISDNQAGYTGGGVDNLDGELTITHTTLLGNQARIGGGIFNGGTLDLSNSTLSGNVAEEIGGGLDNNQSAAVTNVTFYGNSAALDPDDPQGKLGLGGGIFSDWNITLQHVTIASNTGDGLVNRGSAIVKGSLMAGNTGANCTGTGTLTSQGYNLEGGHSCGFSQIGDQIDTDPQLGALADNGGPTMTIALQDGSPALDAGGTYNCPVVDQRGAARPQPGSAGGTQVCDIGAYEKGVFFTRLLLPAMLKR